MTILEATKRYNVDLKKIGDKYSGLCPFHEDTSPSFFVYPATQSWYCFSCNFGGSVVDFVARIENIDKSSAKKIVFPINLDSLKVKLSKVGKKKGLDFENETKLLLARACRKYLQLNPNYLYSVLKILRYYGSFSGRGGISYKTGRKLVESFQNSLYNIKRERKNEN